jgi:hypothetical protein
LKTNEGGAKKRGKREQEAASDLRQRTPGNDLTQRAPRSEAQRAQRKKLGGNADGYEKKGVVKTATQKLMKTRE